LGSQEKPLAGNEDTIGLWQSVKLTLGHTPFRWFLVANLGKELIFLIVVATMPFYARYALKLTDTDTLSAGDQEALMLALPVIATIPLLALWGRITPIIGVRVAWMAANLLYVPGLTIMYFADQYSVALLGAVLLAPGLAGLMMLPHVLLAEVIDSDADRVGQRREGIFFGINGAAVKLAFSIQGLLFGIVFEWTGFVPKAAAQSELAISGIRFLLAIAPIGAAVMSMVALYCCSHDRRGIERQPILSGETA
jgi:GPH family glycoside/pentoside/hexuronide:cation symporter